MEENKTAEKAQEALDQLSEGKKTINQAREEYGLPPVEECEDLMTKE